MLDTTGYLRRLGFDGAPAPSVTALFALHRAQVERIAYNTIDIHLGRRTTVDPVAAAGRVVATGRGGYCFHLNGALAEVLAALGFTVRRHQGWVCGRADPDGARRPSWPNHLALTVHNLPTADHPDGVWFVDAGLGDALHEPLPLRRGAHPQGPFQYGLADSTLVPGGWQFTHDPGAGSFVAMHFERDLATTAQFRGSHRRLSTKPESPFVQRVLAQRRDRQGLDKLVGCTLSRVDASGTTTIEVLEPAEWFAVLSDVFSLTLEDTSAGERDRLWRRAYESHLAWKQYDAR